MDLQLSITGTRDTTRQIYRQLRERILDGRLRSGERLPSSRDLADELAIARKTVTNVFDLLISEGFLETRAGSGTFVANGISGKRDTRQPAAGSLTISESWKETIGQLTSSRPEAAFDFDLGVPDVSQFPFAIWRSIIGGQSRLLSRNAANYAGPRGYGPLRNAIAKYTGFTRAVACTPDDVIVTGGAQQAFSLISDVLIAPGTVVSMEHPGYERARWLFESRGAKIAEIPVDNEGMVVERLPSNAKLIYVTPSHQFPMGVAMSLPRRLALLDWAATHGAAIIEDDYDSEFRFAARPLDSLQSLDRHGVVLYVGTFSKVLFPGVRVGFVVAPEPVQAALAAARELCDWHGSLLSEATLARFIDEGHLARHIRKMRRVYAGRRAVLLSCIQAELSGRLTPLPGTAGLHIGTTLSDGLAANAVAASALKSSVRALPFGDNGIALGYGVIDETKIREGIGLLSRVMRASET